MSLTIDPNNYKISATRGDDHKIRFTVKNSSGIAYDVSANTFKFTVKESLDDLIAAAKFQRQSPAANGIDLTSATSGLVDVNLVPSNTSTLAGLYYYDLEMTEGGKVYTLRSGIFFVLKDVATPGTAPTSTGVIPDFPNGLSLTALYMLDSVSGQYFKGIWTNGELIWSGPNPTIPF